MSIEMTFPMLVLIVFGTIFVAEWLAKLDSPVINAIAWILGIALFALVIAATVGRMFH